MQALTYQPQSIIDDMRRTIKASNGYKYIRVKDGVISLHKKRSTVINNTGKRIGKVETNKACYPAVCDRAGNITQGTWEYIKKELK